MWRPDQTKTVQGFECGPRGVKLLLSTDALPCTHSIPHQHAPLNSNRHRSATATATRTNRIQIVGRASTV